MLRLLACLSVTLVVACSSAPATKPPFAAPIRDPSWVRLERVPLVPQEGPNDCGAAVLTMVLRYWGHDATLGDVSADFTPASGELPPIRAGQLRAYAADAGLATYLFVGELADLVAQLQLGRPVIVGLVKQVHGAPINHYEVVVGVSPARALVATHDPATGPRLIQLRTFLAEWRASNRLALVTIPR